MRDKTPRRHCFAGLTRQGIEFTMTGMTTDADNTPHRPAPKVETPRVSERVAERLLAMIASGALAPGHRLPGERQLAEEMGVSRVSVRAALQSLKTQGFLSAVQGGGTRVISNANTMDPGLFHLVRVNLENLQDLAEIRCVIEAWAARRAAANATDAQVTEIDDILQAMETHCAKGPHRSDIDIRFHLAIAKASGSAIYMHIVGVIRDILKEMIDYHRYELFPTADEDMQLLDQHRAIFEAIKARDGDAAASAMNTHLTWVTQHYEAERARRGGAKQP